MWGQMNKQCLDQITGKRDNVYISEHVRGLALSTHDPPNYEFAGLCSGPFSMCTCKGIKQFPALGQSWKENHSGWGTMAGLGNLVIPILCFPLGSPSSGKLSPKRCSTQNLLVIGGIKSPKGLSTQLNKSLRGGGVQAWLDPGAQMTSSGTSLLPSVLLSLSRLHFQAVSHLAVARWQAATSGLHHSNPSSEIALLLLLLSKNAKECCHWLARPQVHSCPIMAIKDTQCCHRLSQSHVLPGGVW